MSTVKLVAPVKVYKDSEKSFAIKWNDGETRTYLLPALRASCPCARCVNEWTGERMLDIKTIPESITPSKIFSVGRYAMGIQWSDGHSTGIFSYDYLKDLGEKKE